MDLFKGRLEPGFLMSIGITHLGSGSRGNATVISSGEYNVLVDCGFSLRQTEKRLRIAGFDPNSINSIVVTHHHKDHSASALRASKKWSSNLYCNSETASRMKLVENEYSVFGSLDRIQFSSELSMLAIPVPHEDADNVALVASDGKGERAAIVTDLGEAPDDLIKHLSGCNHISIEANYDHEKLMSGPYPDSLKRRISGRGGHLSNRQTGEVLLRSMSERLKSIVLCHLSESNNAPHLAESEVLLAIGDEFEGNISISKQEGPEFSYWTGQSEPSKILAA
tara:strand:+ start:549 stop:1391 length:843 start_codon:yes stop_codon:yes gene_type:complete